MNITPLATDLDILRIGNSGSTRAEGLHASDLYGDLYKDLMPARYKREGEPDPLLLETGMIFESMLEDGLARRFATLGGEQIERPGELTHTDTFDGHPVIIHYNPDLLIYNGCLRVGEIKATWMSAPRDADGILDPKFDKWFCQIKLYCRFLGTTHARLYGFFVNGYYKPRMAPLLLSWEVEFSQDELDTNYAMICYHGISKGML